MIELNKMLYCKIVLKTMIRKAANKWEPPRKIRENLCRVVEEKIENRICLSIFSQQVSNLKGFGSVTPHLSIRMTKMEI